jgi:hypothetical protein
MPSQKFALVKGGLKRVQITWELFSQKRTVYLDGKELGVIPDDKTLKNGLTFKSKNGTTLRISKGNIFARPLDVRLNEQPLPDSHADPYLRIRHAYVAIFINALIDFYTGLTAATSRNGSMGFAREEGVLLLITGIIYSVMGILVWRESLVALSLIIIGYCIDSLVLLSNPEILRFGFAILTLRAAFLWLMIRGIKPMRAIRAEKAREAKLLASPPYSRAELGVMLLAVVLIGLVAIAVVPKLLSNIELLNADGETNTLATLVANLPTPRPTQTPGPSPTPRPTQTPIPTSTRIPTATTTPIPIPEIPRPLQFAVSFYEYSKSLDRIIIASADTQQLHIYNPETGEDRAIDLIDKPTALALSLDGLFAAVGHDSKVAYIDLMQASLVKTLDITELVGGLAFLSNDWIYVYRHINFPQLVEIASNQTTIVESLRRQDHIFAVSSADGKVMYISTVEGFYRIDAAEPTKPLMKKVHGLSSRSSFSLSWDGNYIYTYMGLILKVSDKPEDDLAYVGEFYDGGQLDYVTRPIGPNWVARMEYYGTLFLYRTKEWNLEAVRPARIIPYPQIVGIPNTEAGELGYIDVLVNAAGTRYYLIFRKTYTEYGLIARDVPPIE